MRNYIFISSGFLLSMLLLPGCQNSNVKTTKYIMPENTRTVEFDYNRKAQVMHSFGASDCWSVQFTGLWPEEKRQRMAELLFSKEFDSDGNPKGIGLSMWRFNIGSGSVESAEESGICHTWRRAECFMNPEGNFDWDKHKGQRWFLDAAKRHGVEYTLGFSISAPYFISKNGLCRADQPIYANIEDDKYKDYAHFMAQVCKELEFDYISPINEPQWDWTGCSQEGMPATNKECSRLIYYLDDELQKLKSDTKIIFGESGDIRYLMRSNTDKEKRDNQIAEVFSDKGEFSVYELNSFKPVVSGHSYWSTWPLDTLVNTRLELANKIKESLPENYSYWQTEFCPMEQNPDNPNGGHKRDRTMNTALYVGRIMHYDIIAANATSWQSWTAISPNDYKDGLIFLDDGTCEGVSSGSEPMFESCKIDGEFRDSKLLWSLGNYSLFIRPGMQRLDNPSDINYIEDAKSLMSSSYIDEKNNSFVAVYTNISNDSIGVNMKVQNLPKSFKMDSFKMYETSEDKDLEFIANVSQEFVIPPKSVVTIINK